jgi:hypothetical protein
MAESVSEETIKLMSSRLIRTKIIRLLVFDAEKEVITQWIPD